MTPDKKATRIQESILNKAEKKALVFLAERQPRWVVSDLLTALGSVGALLVAAGFILSGKNIHWLWLSIFGFFVNWYGDSLDGTLARVRGTQRPIYGYYLDHTVDCINEIIMFLGVGLSPLIRLDLALLILVVYLCLTVNVSVNAHLKSEFKLTYIKLGPTEFRILACLLILALIFIPGIRTFRTGFLLFGNEFVLRSLDIAGLAILLLLSAIYLVTVIVDACGYARMDPMPRRDQ